MNAANKAFLIDFDSLIYRIKRGEGDLPISREEFFSHKCWVGCTVTILYRFHDTGLHFIYAFTNMHMKTCKNTVEFP